MTLMISQYAKLTTCAILLALLSISASPVWAQDKPTTSSKTQRTLSPEEAKKKCQENLSKLDGAKEQWALEFKKANASAVTMQDLIDPSHSGKVGQGYLKRKPVCPEGGTYSLNVIGVDPTCSLGAEKGHVLEGSQPGADKQTSGTAAL